MGTETVEVVITSQECSVSPARGPSWGHGVGGVAGSQRGPVWDPSDAAVWGAGQSCLCRGREGVLLSLCLMAASSSEAMTTPSV